MDSILLLGNPIQEGEVTNKERSHWREQKVIDVGIDQVLHKNVKLEASETTIAQTVQEKYGSIDSPRFPPIQKQADHTLPSYS